MSPPAFTIEIIPTNITNTDHMIVHIAIFRPMHTPSEPRWLFSIGWRLSVSLTEGTKTYVSGSFELPLFNRQMRLCGCG